MVQLCDRLLAGSRSPWWKLAVVGLVLLLASGCVRVRRGWLINLNLSLEWNRIPWRAGPDGHYEVNPPDCVSCAHGLGHVCLRCAGSGPGASVEEKAPQGPIQSLPPEKLHPVPVQPAWPDSSPAEETVPPPKPPQERTAPASSPSPSPAANGTSNQKQSDPPAASQPQAGSWYGRTLSRSWVFRPAQPTRGGRSQQMVRVDSRGRHVR